MGCALGGGWGVVGDVFTVGVKGFCIICGVGLGAANGHRRGCLRRRPKMEGNGICIGVWICGATVGLWIIVRMM